MSEGAFKHREDLPLEFFFSHAFDLLAIVGADGYFKRVNPAFERVLGYSPEELCAVPLVNFLHPDDVSKTKKGIQTLTGGISTISSQNRYRCKDGTYRWFSWNTRPMGELFYTVGRDMTEQVEAAAQIRQLNQDLASKNENLENKIQERVLELQKSEAQVQQLQKMDAIGRLAGGIAHDFNNMLAAISLYCDLLEDEQDPLALQKNVQSIRKATDRAAALTRQLLVFSRKQIVQTQIISLNPVIQQLEKMLSRLIGERLQIQLKLASDLRKVNGDPSQMEQIILNLVVNARDAIPNSGTILVETKNVYLDEDFSSTHLSVESGHYVLLSVTDDGTGMDAETQAKIFEPFFTTKPVGKGTGLGLSTVYGIVKQSRGTIWVYSELGKGTVFKIYLPIVDKQTDEVAKTPTVASRLTGSETILLVEDDEKLRHGFSQILQKRGYQVLPAADGKAALELCRNHPAPIHLLLTDVVLPEQGGFELAQQIKSLHQDLPVLFMSGYTNGGLETLEEKDAENINFIQKPFTANVLISNIQKVLSKTRTPSS